MDVVVDEVIAILQVLAFGDAIGGDEHVDFAVILGQEQRLFLGKRRKQGQELLEVGRGRVWIWDCRSRHASGVEAAVARSRSGEDVRTGNRQCPQRR